MAKRTAISKRKRFEIFKRDSFKCQYCGKSAPDIVLHVDHITPVSKGGTNNPLNLVTACADCNGGKSNVEISDNSAVLKQKQELDNLSEKQEQLKMMLKWRSQLLNMDAEYLKLCNNAWSNMVSGYTLNDSGINSVKVLLKKYSLDIVLKSIEISRKYLRYENGKLTKESVEEAFYKIKGICYFSSLPQEDQEKYSKILKLKWYLRNKYPSYNEKWGSIHINNFIKAGYELSEIEEIARGCSRYWEWESKMIDKINNGK